jgi:hypothetical protein
MCCRHLLLKSLHDLNLKRLRSLSLKTVPSSGKRTKALRIYFLLSYRASAGVLARSSGANVRDDPERAYG